MKRRQFAAIMIAVTVAAQMPLTAFAGSWYLEDGDISVTATEEKQTVYQGDESSDDNDPVITQRDSSTPTASTVTITAEENAAANVTLENVNINASRNQEAAVSANGKGDVTIELAGDNTARSGAGHAGIEKNNDGELCITAEDTSDSLNAAGGYGGAGIGGGRNENGSSITITGGSVTATGGNFGAGIGGGLNGKGSSITITGGSVTAASAGFGAGIGGGNHGSGSDITISGGSVRASGGGFGAGIGGGQEGNGSSITISGGSVTAIGGDYGAGIGGGLNGNGSSITISGGSTTVSGGRSGAGIGGGNGDFGVGGKGSDIVISGDAQLKVQGGVKKDHGTGAAIGDGDNMCEAGGGREVAPDTSDLTPYGKIEYYEPGVDMKSSEPQKVIPMLQREEGTKSAAAGMTQENTESVNSMAAAPAEVSLYRVTDAAGTDIAYTVNFTDGILTITADQDTAILTGYLSGMSCLKAQGVKAIVFGTPQKASAFRVDDLLAQGNGGDNYRLFHNGMEASFTIGAANTDIFSILF